MLFIVHSILAIIPPLNSDEALYWEHSRHLALGYYSSPLTGWLIAAITNFLAHLNTVLDLYLSRFIYVISLYIWTNELTKKKKYLARQ